VRWRLSEGLEGLSIRWIQLHRAADGDMAQWEAARVWWRLSEGLEELSIRWIQLRRTAGGDMVLMGGSPCGG
jgi:hypothetical protein